ncbi:hypothetical protein OY671_009368, partial [Metschnikowia pulcherrima]
SRSATVEERRRVASRSAPSAESPNSVARSSSRDEAAIAGSSIEQCASLSDADSIGCARDAGPEHRSLMARRRGSTEIVTETLFSFGEMEVSDAVSRNPTARSSQIGSEAVVSSTRQHPDSCAPSSKRPESRPAGAYVMFWWCGPEDRRTILQRFAVSREISQDAVGDVFAMASAEGWQDPSSRKALQFI